MSIPRYTIVTVNNEWQVRGDPDGAWVRIEDVRALEADIRLLIDSVIVRSAKRPDGLLAHEAAGRLLDAIES